jgi:hypothetical protein
MDFEIAKNHIDKAFGQGYANNHPEIVVQYLQAYSISEMKVLLKNIFELLNEHINKDTIPSKIIKDKKHTM